MRSFLVNPSRYGTWIRGDSRRKFRFSELGTNSRVDLQQTYFSRLEDSKFRLYICWWRCYSLRRRYNSYQPCHLLLLLLLLLAAAAAHAAAACAVAASDHAMMSSNLTSLVASSTLSTPYSPATSAAAAAAAAAMASCKGYSASELQAMPEPVVRRLTHSMGTESPWPFSIADDDVVCRPEIVAPLPIARPLTPPLDQTSLGTSASFIIRDDFQADPILTLNDVQASGTAFFVAPQDVLRPEQANYPLPHNFDSRSQFGVACTHLSTIPRMSLSGKRASTSTPSSSLQQNNQLVEQVSVR